MNFYTQQHKYYCGIDLHAKTMYLCILNQEGGYRPPAQYLEPTQNSLLKPSKDIGKTSL